MFTSARRIAGPAIGILLLLGAVVHPAFGQSYTATPTYISIDCYQEQSGLISCSSNPVGGLPSVSAKGATVNLDWAYSWTIYRGGGGTYVQYQSDLEPTWTTIVGVWESESVGVSGYVPETVSVSVSNLSSLKFRLYLTAATGGPNTDGYALGSGTLANVSVTPTH
jgi:hypothetical protein